MRLRDLAFVTGFAGAAAFVYGMLYEADELVIERRTLPLDHWPERLRGFRIALIGDLHLRDKYSYRLAQEAIAATLAESPDMVVLIGDLVARWKSEMPKMLGDLLEPLLLMDGNAVAVPGNHEYHDGPVELLGDILGELNIKLLRNESWKHAGITWVGVDSANEYMANPCKAMEGYEGGPAIALWHEPDLVGNLPPGCSLQLSGHSHGGQFRLPGGFAPMHSKNGKKYDMGFYPKAPTPLYVTRGIGTTGPPSRFLCPPELSILTLVPAHSTPHNLRAE